MTKVGTPTFCDPRPARQLGAIERASLALLRDHERPDAEIAGLAGCDERDVAYARRLLEQVTISGIPRWRPGRRARQHQDQAGVIEALGVVRTGRSLRGMALANSSRQLCRRGHKLTPDNVSWIRDTKTGNLVRRCKACHRLRERASRGLPPDHVPAAMPGDRERCPAGHLYEGANLIINTRKDGRQARRCAACHRE